MGKKDKAGKSSKAASAAGVCIIEDVLYLGPASAASDAAFLTSKAITHVVSIGHDPPTKLDLRITDPMTGRATALQYHLLRLVDSGSSLAPLEACVDAASELLEQIRAKKERVFVHCSAGISRSPTVVVAYMMRHWEKTLKEALFAVVDARPAVSPNPEFIVWLKEEEVRVRGGESTLSVDRLPAKQADRLALLRPQQ
ncbi:phosphatases II [Trametes sanguinea]|nr:phosphatases II [Trametes sanguinea]